MRKMDEQTAPARVLEVRGVSKAYGKTRALSGIELSVDAGEFVALLGPNGAGKSTLFQLLTGLSAADAGEIAVAGVDLRQDPAGALARIGVVFQQPALDLDLTVWGNLQFHARLHGCRNARRRIDEMLAQVGLTEHGRKRARTLSGGNRRRVELARALLHRPPLLLVDEPTVGLDPASRQQLLAHVRELCREQGVGVLWATHLVDEAEDADRIIILDRGKKVAEGAPRELLVDGNTSLTQMLIALSRPSVRAVAI
jgi:ABC-2 type transport system ATP-binding protein